MNEIVKSKSKEFFSQPVVQEKLKELLGKNAAAFATSVLQIVNSNSMLVDADPKTVFSAACMAATLNLPISNSLGFAYIVPFNNRKENKIEAQFMIGWKGYVQLAQRSGQFVRIVATMVYKDQIVEFDVLNGHTFDWSRIPVNNEEPVGYLAYFKLINGFTADLYMSKEEVQKHANKYSQTARKGYGVWKDQFDAMALKTVLKLLLSKQAPLSIEMQQAELSDQSVVRDIDNQEFEYPDNEIKDVVQQARVIGDAKFPDMENAVKSGKLKKEDALNPNIYALTEYQYEAINAIEVENV